MFRNPLLLAALLSCVVAGAFLLGRSTAQEKKMPRLYELRTYTALEGRLPALEKRFKDHTCKLFEKHGMKNGMYWIPTDPKLKANRTAQQSLLPVAHLLYQPSRNSFSKAFTVPLRCWRPQVDPAEQRSGLCIFGQRCH